MTAQLLKKITGMAEIAEIALAVVLAVVLLCFISTSWIFPDPDDREWYYST